MGKEKGVEELYTQAMKLLESVLKLISKLEDTRSWDQIKSELDKKWGELKNE